MVEVTTNFTVTSILTILVVSVLLLGMGGCTYKYFNPVCDLRGNDHYNEFVKDFGECSEDENKCGEFLFSDVPNDHSIILNNEFGDTTVSLFCDGRESESEFFKGVGLCSYVEIRDEYGSVLGDFEIDKYGDGVYAKDGAYELRKFGDNEVCFVIPTFAAPSTGTY